MSHLEAQTESTTQHAFVIQLKAVHGYARNTNKRKMTCTDIIMPLTCSIK